MPTLSSFLLLPKNEKLKTILLVINNIERPPTSLKIHKDFLESHEWIQITDTYINRIYKLLYSIILLHTQSKKNQFLINIKRTETQQTETFDLNKMLANIS